MTRLRWAALVAVVVAVGVAGVVVSAREPSQGGDAPAVQTRLGGADLVGSPTGDSTRPAFGVGLAELRLGGSNADDFRAYDVRTGAEGSLYLLTGWTECDAVKRCYGVIARFGDDMVIDAAPSYADAYPGQLAVAPTGSVAQISPIARVYDFTSDDVGEALRDLPFQALSGSYRPDGTLIASRIDAPDIVAVRPDGSVERLLAPVDSPEPAPARFDSDTAALTVVALADGRIAFATNAPDDPDVDGRVFVLSGSSVQPVELPDADPIRRIFPGPDGTLLALEGPHISQIDPATATVDRLIDLSEVADELAPASDEWPPKQDISAAAHGNDLLFTADYQLWRLPDAFE